MVDRPRMLEPDQYLCLVVLAPILIIEVLVAVGRNGIWERADLNPNNQLEELPIELFQVS